VEGRRIAFQYGLTPDVFWTMTPWETTLWCKEACEREAERYRVALWSGWHQAAFHRTKRLPRLATLLKRLTTRKRMGQSSEDLRETMRVFAEQADAIDLRKKKDA
jgi:hypothetical protein